MPAPGRRHNRRHRRDTSHDYHYIARNNPSTLEETQYQIEISRNRSSTRSTGPYEPPSSDESDESDIEVIPLRTYRHLGPYRRRRSGSRRTRLGRRFPRYDFINRRDWVVIIRLYLIDALQRWESSRQNGYHQPEEHYLFPGQSMLALFGESWATRTPEEYMMLLAAARDGILSRNQRVEGDDTQFDPGYLGQYGYANYMGYHDYSDYHGYDDGPSGYRS
ncbi:hypothetical protein F5Y04DRAFT_276781 [Hypomontagnella monticulosa]|nr:hypothetical protein F5Y04DRAFT_276781 [Hypomontagnella monticulosa]